MGRGGRSASGRSSADGDAYRQRRASTVFSATLAAIVVLLAAVPALASAPAMLAGPPAPRPMEPPYVSSTDPADSAMGVPVYQWIVVQFTGLMNASNTIVRIEPPVAFTFRWFNLNTTLFLFHDADFRPCTTYWLYVDGADIFGQGLLMFDQTPGVPNPWTFTTACSVFTITRTEPADGQTNVPVAECVVGHCMPIAVWFSRPADPSSLAWTMSPYTALTLEWSNGNTKALLHYPTWLPDCALHTVTVSARDAQGNALTNATGSARNPWNFTTVCILPRIMTTIPADGATRVNVSAPIVVTFSSSMSPGTVAWSVDPPGVGLAPNWTYDDTVLTLAHATPFPLGTTVTVAVGGNDTRGNPLVPGPVPNPWSFTTTAGPAPGGLHVARAPPDVVLSWSPVPGAASYVVYGAPDRLAAWPWPRIGEVTASSFRDSGAEGDGAPHYYVVRAKSGSGVEGDNSTMGAVVPLAFPFDPARTNVFWVSLPFRSEYRSARTISDALTAAKIDVVAKWDAAAGRSTLWFYFRGAWRGVDFSLRPGEAFYLGAVSSFTWVVNGTDDVQGLSFDSYAPSSPPLQWIGLPYTSAYARASDLVAEIEGGLGPAANRWIVEVARWDAAAQRFATFAWTPSGWGGTDFPLAAGEGIGVRVVAPFTWTPRLITPVVP